MTVQNESLADMKRSLTAPDTPKRQPTVQAGGAVALPPGKTARQLRRAKDKLRKNNRASAGPVKQQQAADTKAQTAVGKGGGKQKGKDKGGGKGGGKRAPDPEWAAICGLPEFRNGRKLCRYWNSSVNCKFGDQCKALHECLQCPGEKHKFVTRHL